MSLQTSPTACQPGRSADIWNGAAGDETTDNKIFQISMEAARVNAKLTQDEAAKLQGVSRATIISWERGKTIPTIPRLNKMSEVYGIPVDYIFLPT